MILCGLWVIQISFQFSFFFTFKCIFFISVKYSVLFIIEQIKKYIIFLPLLDFFFLKEKRYGSVGNEFSEFDNFGPGGKKVESQWLRIKSRPEVDYLSISETLKMTPKPQPF